MGQIGKGLEYLKSIPCILKAIEFVILLVAIGMVGYFLDNVDAGFFILFAKKGNLQFFLFAVVAGWLLVIALLALFTLGLHEKVTMINWPLTVGIILAVWALLLLISSALVADTVSYYESGKSFYTVKISACKLLEKIQATPTFKAQVKGDPQCWQLIGGTVCGFIGMILFAIDAVIHFRMYMTRGAEATT